MSNTPDIPETVPGDNTEPQPGSERAVTEAREQADAIEDSSTPEP